MVGKGISWPREAVLNKDYTTNGRPVIDCNKFKFIMWVRISLEFKEYEGELC